MKALTPPRLLAATAATCLLLPSCERNTEAKNDPQWWRLEAERSDLASQVEVCELKLSKVKGGDQGLAGLQADVARSVAKRRELAAQRDALRDEISIARADMDATKLEWMRTARAAATGREFAKFTGARGRTYENAVITKVTDVGVEFRHATGTARLAANDLTPAQHDMFGLDSEIAGAAIREEQQAALAYHSYVDERVAANAETERANEEERVAMAQEAEPAPVVAATPRMSSFSPTSLQSSSRLGDRTNRYSGSDTTIWYSGYSRPSYRYYSGGSAVRSTPSVGVLYDPYSVDGRPPRVNAPTYNYTPRVSTPSTGTSSSSGNVMRSPSSFTP
ncbi:hypothetical protein [Luteolibacter soli]|uniref:Uncharacterized protein n=1 Tax=Luteolibacter soli TaxID=3135280 RepID=A0ABU9AY71_9BACT